MSSREIRELGRAGLLHDIGKSKIPPELLNKTGRLTDEAFSQRDAVEMIMAMTDDLHVSAMCSFLCSVILCPPGSTAILNNSEQARVVKNTPGYPLHPKVIGLKQAESMISPRTSIVPAL